RDPSSPLMRQGRVLAGILGARETCADQRLGLAGAEFRHGAHRAVHANADARNVLPHMQMNIGGPRSDGLGDNVAEMNLPVRRPGCGIDAPRPYLVEELKLLKRAFILP